MEGFQSVKVGSCSITKLVVSKAKLTALDHKEDAVKAEMCGAEFASRLRRYFDLQS